MKYFVSIVYPDLRHRTPRFKSFVITRETPIMTEEDINVLKADLANMFNGAVLLSFQKLYS